MYVRLSLLKRQICGIAGLTALQTLLLGVCGWITDAYLAAFSVAPLQDIDLSFCEQISNDGVRCHLAGKPLTSVWLTGCTALDDRVFQILKDMPLVTLYLTCHGNNFTIDGVKGLLKAVPSLKELNLDFTSEQHGSVRVHGQASGRWLPDELVHDAL